MNLEGLLCLHEPRDAHTFADFRLCYSLQLIAIRDSRTESTPGERRLASRLLGLVGNASRVKCLAMIQTPQFIHRVYRRITR